jgi:uracil-DNA glycosylase
VPERSRPGLTVADYLRYFRDLGVRDVRIPSKSPPPREPLAQRPPPAVLRPGTDAVATDPDLRPVVPSTFESLAELEEFAALCPRCKLSASRTHLVFGQGNPNADLMFIGEAPGQDEDAQGLAFVGRAGQLLTKIIEAIGRKRGDVYIANVLKCRPPGNRNPQPDEVEACIPYLREQIRLIRPRVAVLLGTFAAQAVLETDESIGRLRGRFHKLGNVQVMPTYHPAFLLRTPEKKREVWEDMKKVKAVLEG